MIYKCDKQCPNYDKCEATLGERSCVYPKFLHTDCFSKFIERFKNKGNKPHVTKDHVCSADQGKTEYSLVEQLRQAQEEVKGIIDVRLSVYGLIGIQAVILTDVNYTQKHYIKQEDGTYDFDDDTYDMLMTALQNRKRKAELTNKIKTIKEQLGIE